ncbi:MAG: hypothetical protein HY052_03860 [Proteobacteria bacterium]|nr:hypothetical protein [Pseudomonadota bacterium]
MRGKFITPWLASSCFLAGCALMPTLTLTPGSEDSADMPLTMGVAQVAPAMPPLTRAPRYVVCGGKINCPSPTKKTLDLGDPVRNAVPVSMPLPAGADKEANQRVLIPSIHGEKRSKP